MASPIDPSQIPGENLNPDEIEAAARQIGVIATKTTTQGATVLASWQKISAHYVAPEAGTLFHVMDAVKTNAEAFGGNLGKVAAALDAFAEEVRPIKAELAQIKADANAFVSDIAGGVEKKTFSRAGVQTSTVEWQEDEASVNANNALVGRVNDAMVKLWAAERACANKIYDTIGYAHVEAASEGNPNGYGVNEIPEGTEMPWGAEVERAESCGESTAKGIGRFVWDGVIVGGIWGTVKGLGTLTLGYNPATGDFFSGDAYAAGWKNIGMLGVGIAANTIVPGGGVMLAQLPGPVGGFFAAGNQTLVNTGKGFIAYDRWSEDPWAAAGETTFNLATIVIPAGAAVSGVKAGGSTAAAAMRTAARVVDFADPASLAFKGAGAAARTLVPSVGDLAKAFDLPEAAVFDNFELAKLDGSGARMPDRPFEVPSVGERDFSFDPPASAADSTPDIPPVREPEAVRDPVTVGGGGEVPVTVADGAHTTPAAATPAGGGAGVPGGGGAIDTPAGGSGGGAGGTPIDPPGVQVRPDHGSMPDEAAAPRPEEVSSGVRDLGPDLGAPYGRDAEGQPYTRAEHEARFVGPDGQPARPGEVTGPHSVPDDANTGTLGQEGTLSREGSLGQASAGDLGDIDAGGHDAGTAHPGSGREGLTVREVSLAGDGKTPELLHANIEPNARYVVDGGKFIYETDHLGRVDYAEGYLDTTDGGLRNAKEQISAGGADRVQGDHGGHFFATLFNGPGEGINLTAMDGRRLNLSEYRRLENIWARAIGDGTNGVTVQVRIEVTYPTDVSLASGGTPSGGRPAVYEVGYTLDGANWESRTFRN